jgi:hypothetical protein
MKDKLVPVLNVALSKIEEEKHREKNGKVLPLIFVEKLTDLGCTCEWYKNEDHMGHALPMPRKTGFLTLSLNKDLNFSLDCFKFTHPCYVSSPKRDFAVLIPEEVAMRICTLEHLP